MRKCTKCGIEKDESEFVKQKDKKSGLSSNCKTCRNSMSKIHYYKNKELILIKHKKYYDSDKEKQKNKGKIYRQNNVEKEKLRSINYRQNNIIKVKNKSKQYNNSDAKFNTFIDKLTLYEEPRVAEDGISLEVKCKYCNNYFIPSNRKVSHRIQCLNGSMLGDGYLFDSSDCYKKYKTEEKFKIYKNKLTIEEEIKITIDGLHIEVKCRHCRKYFKPKQDELTDRILALSGKKEGECNLYCSQKCKNECSIYHTSKHPKGFKKHHAREVQPELRKLRLEIDKHKCTYCGVEHTKENKLDCHHKEGIRWESIESADLDMCFMVCEKCHMDIHKKPGCSYHDMMCKDEDNYNLNGAFIPISKTKPEEITEL